MDLARVVGSAQDALSDDIVARLGQLMSDSMILLDRLNRSGVDRLLDILEQNWVPDLFEALNRAANEAREAGPIKGGVTGFWDIVKTPETQEVLRFFMAFGKHFRALQVTQAKKK
ncbi:MAG: hypothetical protein ACREUA_03480 [Burkholderiales bacterium]